MTGLCLVLTWVAGHTLLFAFRHGYLFPPFDQVDTWYYTAFQWNWSRMISEFGATYYGARVSALFVGVMFHNIFGPEVANILTKLFFSGGLALALGWMGNRFGGRLAGIMGVSLAVFSPQVIIALHGDYTDTAVLVYASLSVAAITQAGLSSTPMRWIFLAGMSFTLMTIANLGAVANIGLAVAFFHLAWLDRSLPFHGKCLLVYGSAAVLVGGALHGLNYYLGADWDLISPQWRLVMKLNNLGTDNPWYVEGWQWMVRATWLVIPVSALIWGCYRAYFRPLQASQNQRLLRCLTSSLGFAWLVGLILELRGSQVIGLFYYASSMLALALPLLLLLLGSGDHRKIRTMVTSLAGFALLAFLVLVPDPLVYLHSAKWLKELAGASEAVLWLGWAILLAIFCGGTLMTRGTLLNSPIFGILIVSGVVYLSLPRTHRHFSYADRLKERYQLIHETSRFVDENFEPDHYRFWIDSGFSDSATLAASRLWGYRLWTNRSFPEIDAVSLSHRTILVPRPPGDAALALQQMATALERIGLEPTNTKVHHIQSGNGIGFNLIQFTPIVAQYDPTRPKLHGPTPIMIAGFEYSGEHSYTRSLGIFAHNGGPARIENSAQAPVFHRGTPIDYAFTNFRPLPANSSQRRLGLVIYMNTPGDLTLTVEDDFNRQFEVWDMQGPGRHYRIIQVPNDASFYRLRLYSKQAEQTALPNNINIYYMASPLGIGEPPLAD